MELTKYGETPGERLERAAAFHKGKKTGEWTKYDKIVADLAAKCVTELIVAEATL